MTLNFMFLNWQQDQLEDTALSDSAEEDGEEEDQEAAEQSTANSGAPAKYQTMEEYQTYVSPPMAPLLYP